MPRRTTNIVAKSIRKRKSPKSKRSKVIVSKTSQGRVIELKNAPFKQPFGRLRVRFRVLFFALLFGTLLVTGSAAYAIRTTLATEDVLFGRTISREYLLAHEVEPFISLILDLENQDLYGDVSLRPLPREYLKREAEAKGFNYSLLDRIAFCESRWRMVKNSKSSAFGYFQILDQTERTTPQYQEGLRKHDPYVNIDMALNLYERQGTRPWNESIACWARYQ